MSDTSPQPFINESMEIYTPAMDWEALFAASSQMLKTTLMQVRASFAHRGLKGGALEKEMSDWFKLYLPHSVDALAGEMIDCGGRRSRQVDVLLADRYATASFFSNGDQSVLPVESVFAAVEIKTYLNKGEIENAFENMRAAKALEKRAYFPDRQSQSNTLYGQPPRPHWPLQFFVFAFESDGLDSVLGHVARLNDTQPIDKRIDMVCVLDKGLIVNIGPEGMQPIPLPGTTLTAKKSSKALLTFYALLTHLLGQTYSEPVAMHHYLSHIRH